MRRLSAWRHLFTNVRKSTSTNLSITFSRDLSARLFYKMKRENIELANDVNQALDRIDFDTSQK